MCLHVMYVCVRVCYVHVYMCSVYMCVCVVYVSMKISPCFEVLKTSSYVLSKEVFSFPSVLESFPQSVKVAPCAE